MMDSMASVNSLFSRFPTKRRTTRIAMLQTIGVTGQDRSGQEFTVGGKATNLNYYGAAITVPRQVPVGTTLKVRNNHKLEATVKVVSQVKAVSGMHSYGVQFVEESAGFWGIHFPLADPNGKSSSR
jgi:hypothetical protein